MEDIEVQYKVLVAFESWRVGATFDSTPTPRLNALVAAGYLAQRDHDNAAWRASGYGAAAEAAGAPKKAPARRRTGRATSTDTGDTADGGVFTGFDTASYGSDSSSSSDSDSSSGGGGE